MANNHSSRGRRPLPKRTVLIRKLKKQYAGVIILGLLLLSVGLSGFYFGHAFGSENYRYNMSKNESDQIIISELCYAEIDLGECHELYGDLDKQYGEPEK